MNILNPWTDREVEAHWDAVADRYVAENDRVSQAHDQRFMRGVTLLEPKAGDRILNITSRDAGADPALRQACPQVRVVHAEISAGLMRVAATRNPKLEQHKLSSYSSLPFPDVAFDRILSLETLEHVAEPLAFLRELRRVVVPGGRMVLSCPPATSEFPYRLYTALFGGHGEGPHRFPASREVKTWLSETGWTLRRHEGTVLIPVGPAWLQTAGEWVIGKLQRTWVSELGIRQFYVCGRVRA